MKRFTEFGGTVHQRPVEDLAFAVARFIQKGGSYINYYMVTYLSHFVYAISTHTCKHTRTHFIFLSFKSAFRQMVNHGLWQYHGGTNFGRTAGGPFITTSYDYDAPIDEYGERTDLIFSVDAFRLQYRNLTIIFSTITGLELSWKIIGLHHISVTSESFSNSSGEFSFGKSYVNHELKIPSCTISMLPNTLFSFLIWTLARSSFSCLLSQVLS